MDEIEELNRKLSRQFVEKMTQDVYRSIAELQHYVSEGYNLDRMAMAGYNLRWCSDRVDEFLEIESAKTTE